MRIGIDATALPPQPLGAGNYIIQLVRALAGLEGPHEWVIFAQDLGRQLIDLPSRPGFEWVIAPTQAPARRLAWEQLAFPSLVRRSGVALLHSLHYTRPLLLPCPSVVTFHDMTFFLFPGLHTRSKRVFFPLTMRYSARFSQALIAVSESTRRDAIRLLGLPEEKITAIPLGVTPGFHPIRDPARLAEVRDRYRLPEHFILYVGAVEPRKSLPLLVDAYYRLGQVFAAPPLVVVGRFGWMYQEVLDRIQRLGLEEKVHFAGYATHEDLPIVYNLADVFVYPSLYEGFGLPPLEAMACGTPVVTTAVSSLPEHVGDAGLLVPPGDEQALTAAIQRVLQDRALQDILRRKGPERARQFSWDRTARETLQVYRRVLSSS